VLSDQVAAYDELRPRCPVAYSDYLGWSLLRHADVLRAAGQHTVFSNAVSAHLSVPNGMDPPEHTEHRRINEAYFTDELMAEFEPQCREVARALVAELPRGQAVDFMEVLARPLALRLQSRWLGWPDELHQPLREWTLKNHRATLARDRDAMAAVALEFDSFIEELLDHRRRLGTKAPDDLTTRLLTERIGDRPLTDAEIVSILRNWTVGELSTIAAGVAILAHFLAENPETAGLLRAQPEHIPAAVEEILRIRPPLIANRRVTTRDTEVGGRQLPAGERVTLLWASANRDEAVFGDPDEFRLDRDPRDNLLYGAGIHVCPGAPLARLELRVTMEEVLAGTDRLWIHGVPTLAAYPASGFSVLPLIVT
jgi:cytochrome P450